MLNMESYTGKKIQVFLKYLWHSKISIKKKNQSEEIISLLKYFIMARLHHIR